MRKIFYLLVVCFVYISIGCKEECEDTEMEEINFYFVPYGTTAKITDAAGADITGQVYSDVKLTVSTYKCYCNGKTNGPFDDMYNVTMSGNLDKITLGAMEYRMDNSKDMMMVKIVATSSGGDWILNGDYRGYKEIQPFDEGNYNVEFKVSLKYDTGTKKITAGEVTYIAP